MMLTARDVGIGSAGSGTLEVTGAIRNTKKDDMVNTLDPNVKTGIQSDCIFGLARLTI